MVRFAANLTMLFTEHAFLDRFAAATDAGFTAVEFLPPCEYESRQIADAIEASGLRLVLHKLPSGNWAGGERGIACLPDRTAEFRAGVARAIEYASALGCTRLNCLEPVNTRDVPGLFVSRTAHALLDAVGDDNVKLQFDIYYTQVMEGNLARSIETHFSRIGHLQLASNPGRHEPGTGEINYRYLFEQIDALGYDSWIGCEYKPKATTAAGLGWIKEISA